MIQSTVFLILTMLLLSLPGSVPAQVLTPEMVVDMRWVTSVAMQPQGKYVAYTLRVQRGAEEEPGDSYSELWVVPVRGGQARVYIQKPHSARSIGWTRDGHSITFLSRRENFDKNTQVYSIPLDGGEPRPLSHAPRNISHYALSPDGRLLAYTMREEEPSEVKEAREAGFDQKIEDTWDSVTRLYVEDLQTGDSHLVTQDAVNVWDFTWASDGKQLIYRASIRPYIDDKYMFTDNYIVPVEGGKGRKIYDTDGKLELAHMSPDGKYFAWLGAVSLNDPYAGSLFILPVAGGEPKNLLENFPGTGISFVWKDQQTILLTAIEKNRAFLYQVSIPDGRMKRLLGDTGPIFRQISLSESRKLFATAASSYNHPNEVFLGTLGGKPLKRLTISNPEFEQMKFGQQETISWPGPDNVEIFGLLVKPVRFVPGKRYPLQVQVHGGPESARLDGWNTYYSSWVQLLAQRGYMILIPNYRGSIGRGVRYAMSDQRDMMGKEFEDILAGIDYLERQGLIDPQRVGIGGGSYGGYASAWAATRYSDRFQAAVVFAGASNQISKNGTNDIPAEISLVHWDFWLYDNVDLAWDRSPLKYISQAHTPTLIAHGELDRRVPVGQAYELYRGLKYMKVPTQLVIYPREPHGLKERAHQLDYCRRALDWYEKYLKSNTTHTE